MLSRAEELFWILIVGGSALAGTVLAYPQRPAYASWTCTYGNRSLQEAGCLIPMVVCLGSLIIGLGWFMLGFD